MPAAVRTHRLFSRIFKKRQRLIRRRRAKEGLECPSEAHVTCKGHAPAFDKLVRARRVKSDQHSRASHLQRRYLKEACDVPRAAFRVQASIVYRPSGSSSMALCALPQTARTEK